jgi:hypothetical protein
LERELNELTELAHARREVEPRERVEVG